MGQWKTKKKGGGGFLSAYLTTSDHVNQGHCIKDTVPELVAVLNWVELSTKVFGSEQKSLSACGWAVREG